MKEKSRTATIQELLGAVINNLDAPGRELLDIHGIWHQAVGPRIAQNTFPTSLRKGTLTVHVTTSVWMQELQFMKGRILEKLNSQKSPGLVKEIFFKIGPVRQPPTPAPDDPLPDLGAEETAIIEKNAACIEDENLRRAFEGIMAAYLKNKKQESS